MCVIEREREREEWVGARERESIKFIRIDVAPLKYIYLTVDRTAQR